MEVLLLKSNKNKELLKKELTKLETKFVKGDKKMNSLGSNQSSQLRTEIDNL